ADVETPCANWSELLSLIPDCQRRREGIRRRGLAPQLAWCRRQGREATTSLGFASLRWATRRRLEWSSTPSATQARGTGIQISQSSRSETVMSAFSESGH